MKQEISVNSLLSAVQKNYDESWELMKRSRKTYEIQENDKDE